MSEAVSVAMEHEALVEVIETAASHALHGMPLSHEQHVEVCAEIGRLAAGQIAGRATTHPAHVSPQPAQTTPWPDWSRPGWILSSRVLPALAEVVRVERGPWHAVSRALTAWDNYGELAAADHRELAVWSQDHQASPDDDLREIADAIEKFLAAQEARAAFLTSVTSGWVSQHAVEVDVAVIRRACEMVIRHRPRDGSSPHVTVSADVLLALAQHAQRLCDGLLAERATSRDPSSGLVVLAELAARGPVVGGEGAPDAEGSVVQPAPHAYRWHWIEGDEEATESRSKQRETHVED